MIEIDKGTSCRTSLEGELIVKVVCVQIEMIKDGVNEIAYDHLLQKPG